MKDMKIKDLKHRLRVMIREQKPTPTGGIEDIWHRGPFMWGHVEPLASPGGYSAQDPTGGLSAGQGSLSFIPPVLYRVSVPLSCQLTHVRRLIWYDYSAIRTLDVTRHPQLTRCHKFQSILTMEIPHAHT